MQNIKIANTSLCGDNQRHQQKNFQGWKGATEKKTEKEQKIPKIALLSKPLPSRGWRGGTTEKRQTKK